MAIFYLILLTEIDEEISGFNHPDQSSRPVSVIAP